MVSAQRITHLSPLEASFLVLLAEAPGRRLRRETLCRMLWPESDEANSRHSLKQLTYQVRTKLGREVVLTSGRDIAGGLYDVDVLLLKADHKLAGNDLARGWFLPEFHPASSELAAWMHAWRVRVERFIVSVAEEVVLTGNRDDLDRAEVLLQYVPPEYQTPSLFEQLTRLKALQGDTDAAVAVYRRYDKTFGDVRALPRLEDLLRSVEETQHTVAWSEEVRFVGREAEQQVLRRLWDRSKTGERNAALIMGEPGIGKSRLAQQFLRRVAIEGGIPWHLNCSPSLRRVPWANILEFSRQLSLGSNQTIAQASTALMSSILESLNHATTPTFNPALRLLSAFRDLFIAAQQCAPVTLVIDEIQWADEALSMVIPYLLNNVEDAKLLVVMTGRPTADADLPHWIQSDIPRCTTIHLGPLSAVEAESLVDAVIASRALTLSQGSRDKVVAESAGRPFLLVNGVTSMAANHPVNLEAVYLPIAIEEKLNGVLSVLPEDGKWLASILAVRGKPTRLSELRDLSQLAAREATKAIELLKRHGIVQFSGNRVAFSHDMMREAAYRGTDTATRVLLNQRVAEGLVRIGGDPGTIAEHFAAAGRGRNACEWALEAATRSGNLHLYSDCEYYLQLARSQPCDQATEATRRLVYHLIYMGRHDEAEPLLQLIDSIDPAERELLNALVRLETGDGTSAQQVAISTLEHVGKLPYAASLAPALGLLLDRVIDSGGLEKYDQLTERLLAVAAATPNVELSAHIQVASALWVGLNNGFHHGRQRLDALNVDSIYRSGPMIRAHHAFASATLDMIAGMLTEARPRFHEAMILSQEAGDIRRLSACRLNYGVLCMEAGEFRDAADMFEVVSTSPAVRFKIRAITNLAVLHYEMGHADSALMYVGMLERLNSEYASEAFTQNAAALKGLIGVALKDSSLIDAANSSATQRISILGDPGYVIPFFAWCAERREMGSGAEILRTWALRQESFNRLTAWRLYTALAWLAEEQMTVSEHERLALMLRQASTAGARLLADRRFSSWGRRR